MCSRRVSSSSSLSSPSLSSSSSSFASDTAPAAGAHRLRRSPCGRLSSNGCGGGAAAPGAEAHRCPASAAAAVAVAAAATASSSSRSCTLPAAVSENPSYGRWASRSPPSVERSTRRVRAASTSESHPRSWAVARAQERGPEASSLGETQARRSCSFEPVASSFCMIACHEAGPPMASSCCASRSALKSKCTSAEHSTTSFPPLPPPPPQPLSASVAAAQQLSQWWQRRSPPAPLLFHSQRLSRPSAPTLIRDASPKLSRR